MRIKSVVANNRKRAFDITVQPKANFEFPFSKLSLIPTIKNPIVHVAPDSELGFTGFTFTLKDGAEDIVLMDQVLEYAQDPEFQRKALLFKMTMEAKTRIDQLKVKKRELIRRMNTTPTQFYRLLDQTNTHKTIDQMVKLLNALDCSVDVVFHEADDVA